MLLVLLRHGQSVWNLENRFTGWVDVDLSEQGVAEARAAGRLCKEAGLEFDVVHTSFLKRAILTADLALEEMDLLWIPIKKHWRLNERHYGALTGLDKAETAAKHGDEQVHLWRRSYDVQPPPLSEDDERHPCHDPRWDMVAPELKPATECLRDVVARMMPYWYDFIVPDLLERKRVLVAAHGNSLRALCKHLDGIPDADIPNLEIPTGQPLVYELDDRLRPVERHYISRG